MLFYWITDILTDMAKKVKLPGGAVSVSRG